MNFLFLHIYDSGLYKFGMVCVCEDHKIYVMAVESVETYMNGSNYTCLITHRF